nr:septum site-determining protein MinC [Lupinus angustifolius]
MGFTFDLRDRIYKHRKDRPLTPEPEPTPANPSEPQPSEFYAQSSSYVVMPSNQMIKDELVSLRGYITNQMDAFDSQNQQIQFELHRLSSKLSSMDVDEDSSEPES